MALVAGSKYINSNVPVTGSPVTAVACTATPMPTSAQAGQLMLAEASLTLLLSGAATSNTYRCFILPANHRVFDAWIEVKTTAAAGAITMAVLGQACAAVDGGTALTIDAAAANSAFTQSMAVSSAVRVPRTAIIPEVTTNAVTKNASVGVAVPYDRVIGLTTTTAITTNDAVIDVYIAYSAV